MIVNGMVSSAVSIMEWYFAVGRLQRKVHVVELEVTAQAIRKLFQDFGNETDSRDGAIV